MSNELRYTNLRGSAIVGRIRQTCTQALRSAAYWQQKLGHIISPTNALVPHREFRMVTTSPP